MHAKSLITAALALTAATSLVVLSTRPSQADPAPLPSYQENLEARVKQLEAEVKALRAELKALAKMREPAIGGMPYLKYFFDDKDGESGHKFFFGEGLKDLAPMLDLEKGLKGMPQNLEVETKDGKTILKLMKPGDKQLRTYELPRDKAKLEKDFPNLKMLHGADGTPLRMRMFGPHGDFKAFDSKELHEHMKQLHEKLSKEFGPEFAEKMKKEMEAHRKELEKQHKEEKAPKSEPPAGFDPESTEPISI